MDNLDQLLEQLGLARYAKLFAENDVDLDVLRQLTDEELKELGLTLGHRTKLRAALRRLPNSDASIKPESRSAGQEESRCTDAERRQVSVMFCDLVASTALATQLDPEDYRELIRAYQDVCADVVKRFDGFLAKFMGDGLLIYFGWPRAHEDDAERVINTALGITAVVQSVATSKAAPLSVRVGIATGRVVVGDIVGEGASQEAAIIGEAPNLAARLQAIAEPNTVVVDDTTHSLAGGLFETARLGAQVLKGFSAPVIAWRITGSRTIASRFDATRIRALTPFVAREEEIGILDRRWQRSRSGEGQVVLLSGEAGIGKWIVSAFVERLGGESYTSLRYQCSPYHINSALYPIIEQLAFAARIHSSDPPDRKLDKLEARLALSNRPIETTMPLIAPLLSIPLGDRYPPVNVSPQRRKQLTLAALVELLQGLAEQHPVLFHFEDAHWIDPTSRELLDMVIARASNLALLVVISFRSQFSAPWSLESHMTLIGLNRLDTHACAHLTRKIAGSAMMSADVVDEIVSRADGVPLFVEEMTKTVLEAEASKMKNALTRPAVPASIEASLLARLDHLGSIKEVAQIAAVIGRRFRHDVLAAVVAQDEKDLLGALSRLEAAGLIYRRGVADGDAYEFKHALVCDAAYQSLLKSRRQQHHSRIAHVLEAQFSAVIEPELLAHHYTEAALTEQAIDYWLKAGQRAMQRSAHVEAERHLRKGLELVAALPAGASRFGREITLQNALGVCLMPTRGFSSPEIASLFAQAAELAEQNNDVRGLFVSLRGKGQYHCVSGDLTNARSDGQRILALAEQMSDRDWLIEAHHLNWGTLCFTGEFVDARRHAEEGEALYQRERDHHLTYVYSGHDPGSCGRGHGAVIVGQLGYVERARELARDALALAEGVAHPLSIAIALWHSGLLHQLLREPDAMGAVGERMVRHSSETGLRPMVSVGKIFRGDALTHRGKFAEGIAQIREGIVESRAIGSLVSLPSVLGTLADAFARHGHIDEGLAAIHEGLAMSDTNGDRFGLPEIHRVRGNLLLARSAANLDVAETAYRQAIDIARAQQARLLELRAATTLARLWGENGRCDQARELLTPVYEQFNDGFETPDLNDARALLGELP